MRTKKRKIRRSKDPPGPGKEKQKGKGALREYRVRAGSLGLVRLFAASSSQAEGCAWRLMEISGAYGERDFVEVVEDLDAV